MGRRLQILAATAAAMAFSACSPAPGYRPPADAGVAPPDAEVAGDAGEAADGDLSAMRAACAFHGGARPKDTIDIPAAWPRVFPVDHVIIVVQENHSYDSYFGRLSATRQPDAEPFPTDFSNVDTMGNTVTPTMLTSTCLNVDPPHQWYDAHLAWNQGKMDGFARNGTALSVVYYDDNMMPFYYWLASTFTIADRYFAPVLAGTWANRDYLYAGTSRGVLDSYSRAIPDAPTIFDELSNAGVNWAVYTDGDPFQNTLGWDRMHGGVQTYEQFLNAAASGTLPSVSFVDPHDFSDQDEHPSDNADLQKGQDWSRSVYQAAVTSPQWRRIALLQTWDEWGGFFDHVAPPPACPPTPDQPDFNRNGFRIGMIIASPWVRPHTVSHVAHSHTSITRFIEVLFDLPALTDRDANSDALLDMFDFRPQEPPLLVPPPAPEVKIPNCVPKAAQ
jgi:phospholipase C